MKLTSMTDFVLKQNTQQTSVMRLSQIIGYADFLKQLLALWMFVPCYLRDGVWIPYTKDTLLNTIELFNEYQQAKERCLFEGFEASVFGDCLSLTKDDCNLNIKNGDVEDLIDSYDNIQLSQTAIKLLGI